MSHKENEPAAIAVARMVRDETDRRPYAPPRLERLGEWSALTLQQSIIIAP